MVPEEASRRPYVSKAVPKTISNAWEFWAAERDGLQVGQEGWRRRFGSAHKLAYSSTNCEPRSAYAGKSRCRYSSADAKHASPMEDGLPPVGGSGPGPAGRPSIACETMNFK